MIDDPQGMVPGTIMPRVPMAPSVRELVVTYLGGSGPASAPGSGSSHQRAAAPPARDAPALYGRYCAPCHGVRGRGDGPNARHLPVRPAVHADAADMSLRSDDRLFDAIYGGGYPLGRSATMPAYGETLTAPEVWSVVRYLRTLCRCAGPAWSTDGDRSRRGAPR